MILKKVGILIGASALLCVLSGPLAAGEWRSLDPLDDGRSRLQAAAVGTQIFAAGGSGLSGPRRVFEVYDIDYDFWRPLPAMPQAAEQFGMVATGGEIFLLGGFGEEGRRAPLSDVQVFMPASQSWRQGTVMPSARARHGVVAVGLSIYVVGGVGAGGELTSDVARFDVGANQWTSRVTAMPDPRRDLAVVEVDGLIYAIGGRASDGNPSTRVDIYNTETNEWSRAPNLPSPRAAHVAGVLNGNIHVAGGSGSGTFETLQDHLVYTPGVDSSWRHAEDQLSPRHSHASVVVNDLWYVLGGGAGAGLFAEFTEADVLEVYDPAIN